MTKKPNYLEYKRTALIRDYRAAKQSDRIKILVEIMDLEEELRSNAAMFAKKQAL